MKYVVEGKKDLVETLQGLVAKAEEEKSKAPNNLLRQYHLGRLNAYEHVLEMAMGLPED